jgi:hypothetical protein
VDGNLKVYGIENLRITDGSIMPHVTTGNTMAPCIIIGERAAEILQQRHGLRNSLVATTSPRTRGAPAGILAKRGMEHQDQHGSTGFTSNSLTDARSGKDTSHGSALPRYGVL